MIRPTCAFLFLTGIVLANVLVAGEHGIQMQAVSPWNDPNGYTPVVVTVEATREVDLTVRVDSGDGGATATVRVAEGRRWVAAAVVRQAHSPPTRGSTGPVVGLVLVLEAFPAHAGIDRGHTSEAIRSSGIPRPRGDRPLSAKGCDLRVMHSPPTRGSTRAGKARLRTGVRIPRPRGDRPGVAFPTG